MRDAALKLHSAGAGAGSRFGASEGGFEAGGFGSVEGGFETGGCGSVELAGCSSFDDANDGETIAKDPTAAAWFAINVSRSLAIALPALAAMSDLIADASGTLAPLISEGAGAAGLSPLQPLASINPAASAIRRYVRFCIMTPLLF